MSEYIIVCNTRKPICIIYLNMFLLCIQYVNCPYYKFVCVVSLPRNRCFFKKVYMVLCIHYIFIYTYVCMCLSTYKVIFIKLNKLR